MSDADFDAAVFFGEDSNNTEAKVGDFTLVIDGTLPQQTQIMLEQLLDKGTPDENIVPAFVIQLLYRDYTKQKLSSVTIHDSFSYATEVGCMITRIMRIRKADGYKESYQYVMYANAEDSGHNDLHYKHECTDEDMCEILFKTWEFMSIILHTVNTDNLDKDETKNQLMHLLGMQSQKIKGLEETVQSLHDEIEARKQGHTEGYEG